MKRAREEEQTKDLVSCLMLLSKADDRKQPSSSGRVFACKTCEREFSSFQALGGHRASHKKPKQDLLQLVQPASSPGKAKTHGCPICGVEFTVGQALGGHMRRHRDVLSSAAAPVLKKSNSSKRIPWLNLDLNLAPPGYHLIS